MRKIPEALILSDHPINLVEWSMSSKSVVFLTAILTILLAFVQPVSSLNTQIPQLAVSVTTDKPAYTYRDMVKISGKLWLSGELTNGTVGVEILNPNNQTLVARAVSAGTPTLLNIIQIISVIPCDQTGNPKNIFKKGVEHAHVKVTIKNNDPVSSRHILVTVTACDSDSTPILPQVSFLDATLPPGGIAEFKPDIPLDTWLSTGTATFYAAVFTDWPRKGGLPYTLEMSANFIITSSTGSSSTTQTEKTEAATPGTYNLSFRLPPNEYTGAPEGNYTVNVAAYSQGYSAYASKTFTREHQLDGDVVFDHKIDILDVVAITSVYGSESGDPKWKPEADVFPSGKIDIVDVVVATSKYGQKY